MTAYTAPGISERYLLYNRRDEWQTRYNNLSLKVKRSCVGDACLEIIIGLTAMLVLPEPESKCRRRRIANDAGVIFEKLNDAAIYYGIALPTVFDYLNGRLPNKTDLFYID